MGPRELSPWHERRPELLEELREHVSNELPQFAIEIRERVVLIGRLVVSSPDTERHLDTWQIEIDLGEDYPNSVPVVRETGGRIPWEADSHVYKTGEACLFIPEEARSYWTPDTTLAEFVHGPVAAYYLGHSHFAATGEWPFGGHDHGDVGRVMYWLQELETKKLAVVVSCLNYLAGKRVKGHVPCYCGSDKRLRNCHASKLYSLYEHVPPETARSALRAVTRVLDKLADKEKD